MKNKRTLLILILVIVLLLGGATVLYAKLKQTMASEQLAEKKPQTQDESDNRSEEAQQKTPAPDFTVYDAEGGEVRLSDYVGKPIVLNFWASWCGPCKGEMPDFYEKYLELGEDLHFLMINMTDGSRETVESASEFIAEREYTFPVFYDTQSNAAMTYGVYSLPTTYFIDAEGDIVAQATGAIDAETLQRGIDMIS